MKTWCLAAMLFLGMPFIALSESQVIDYIRVVVNDHIATQNEIKATINDLRLQILRSIPPGPMQKKQLAQITEETVIQKIVQDFLLLDRAKELKMEAPEEELDSRMSEIEEKQPQLLKQFTRSELRKKIGDDILKQYVLSQEVNSKIHISDAEVHSYCQKHSQKLGIAQILVKGRQSFPNRISTAVDKALSEGEAFLDVAPVYSEDPNAAKTDGKLGMFSPGELLPEIDAAAFALSLGETSEWVQTKFGYHRIHIYEQEKADEKACLSLPESEKESIADMLFGKKHQEVTERYFQKLQEKAQVRIKVTSS